MATRAVATWRWSEILSVQPWKAASAAVAALIERVRPARRTIHVPPLSAEWLRRHEIESLKHRDDR